MARAKLVTWSPPALGRKSYSEKVLALDPVGYWPMSDPSGSTAVNLGSLGSAANGTYTSVTLGQPGIGDGKTCPRFDGAHSICNINTSALRAAFDYTEGSYSIWMKVANAGVWTDSAIGRLIVCVTDAGYIVWMMEGGANNWIRFQHITGSTRTVDYTPISSTGWVHLAMTWDDSAVTGYVNGIPLSPAGAAGAKAGNIFLLNIGAYTTDNSVFNGWLAHAAIWDRALTGEEIWTLAQNNDPIINSIQFQTECGVGDTFAPVIALKSGCPYTPAWDFGDSTTDTGLTPSKSDYADAGPHTVTLTIPYINFWLSEIDVAGEKITGDFFEAIKDCKGLTKITTGENTNLTSDLSSLVKLTSLTNLNLQEHQYLMTGDIANLAGLTNLTRIYAAGTGIYGDIGSLAALTSLTYLDLHSNTGNGGITGDLADISGLTGLTYLSLGNTYVTGELADVAGMTNLGLLMLYSSGGAGCGAFTGSLDDIADLNPAYVMLTRSQVSGGDLGGDAYLEYCFVNELGWSQATVDAFLLALYTNRASYTRTAYGATHYLNIGGSNAAPSGVYQNTTPPTTGLEYVYKLANDPGDEGFVHWHIIYTGGDVP